MPIRLELDASVVELARPTYDCAATPADPLPVKRRNNSDLDDPDLDIPDDDESPQADDALALDDDSDFDVDGADDESESIGLDTATGFEDSDDLELSDEGEGERWSTDSEEADELPGTESDLFPGEEYGWTGEDDAVVDDESFDEGIGDDEGESRDDGGAEGLEDDSELDDLDLTDLPEIDADVEEDAGGGNEGFEEMAALGGEEPTVELAPGEHWKLLPAGSLRVRTFATLPQLPSALAHGGQQLFVAAGALWAIDLETGLRQALEIQLPQRAALAFDPLPLQLPLQLPLNAANDQPSNAAEGLSALAAVEHDGALHVAAILRGVVMLSTDGGRNFRAQDLPEPAIQIGFTRVGPQPRLWWLSARGGLRSVDGAHDPGQAGANVIANLGEVLTFHTDGARHLAALVRRGERARVALSGDAGKRFSFHEAPAGSLEPHTRIQVCRGALLLVNDAGVQSAQPPQTFERVSRVASAPATLLNEDDAAFVYGCVRGATELSIVRRSVRTNGSAPIVIASIPLEQAAEPRLIVASYAEGGAVSIYLASDRSLLRVDASLDGEELVA